MEHQEVVPQGFSEKTVVAGGGVESQAWFKERVYFNTHSGKPRLSTARILKLLASLLKAFFQRAVRKEVREALYTFHGSLLSTL
jgi:hypothetical protein